MSNTESAEATFAAARQAELAAYSDFAKTTAQTQEHRDAWVAYVTASNARVSVELALRKLRSSKS